MAKPNGKSKDVMFQRVLAVVILIAVCVLIVNLTGNRNKLEEVVIKRLPGNYSSVTDEEIIRASGLKMGAQIADITGIRESVEAKVNSSGNVKFEDIKRISGRSIEITVSPREAIAVVNSAGNYVMIDKEGYVMDVLAALPTNHILYVTGAEILLQEKGRMFVTRKPEQLDIIIEIALAVKNGGYQSTYSELNVKDTKDILLITNTSQIIEIFDGAEIEKTLQIADGIIKEGKTKGRISISGNYAGYQSPE